MDQYIEKERTSAVPQSHACAYGSPLHRQSLQPKPEDAQKRIFHATLAGKSFGHVAAHLGAGEVLDEGKTWLSRLNIPTEGPEIGTWNYAYRGAFWFAASHESRKRNATEDTEHYGNASHFGGRSQRDITRALFDINHEDRKWLFRRFQGRRKAFYLDWRKSYTGALGVARTAHAVLALNASVIFPKLHVDTHLKIDLLAFAHDHLYAFQVKSDRGVGQSSYRLLSPPYDAYDRGVALAMKQFERRYQVTCVPVILTLGRDGREMPWDSDRFPYLRSLLTQLLNE